MSYDKVSLLLPMNGANGGVVFPDYSPVPKTLTVAGSAQTNTDANSPYGSSLTLNGTNAYLEMAHNAAFLFPASTDFCIEATIELDTLAKNFEIVHRYAETANAARAWIFQWTTANGLTFDFRNAGGGSYISTIRAAWSPSTGTKYKVAVSREGTTYRLFADGALLGTVVEATAINQPTSRIQIGYLPVVANYSDGKMHDLRITTGAAVRTAAYTPETRLTGFISNTAVGASKILDVNGDPAERTVFAVPRIAPVRAFSDVSNASGEFEIQAPAGVDHSVVALADETGLRNDIVHRVIPV